jgi:hypothetical protein
MEIVNTNKYSYFYKNHVHDDRSDRDRMRVHVQWKLRPVGSQKQCSARHEDRSRHHRKRLRNSSFAFNFIVSMKGHDLIPILFLIFALSIISSQVFAATSANYYSMDYNNKPKPQPTKKRPTPYSFHPQNILIQSISDWYASHIQPNMKHWPKVQCRIEPTTTLKIRKTFRPFKTIVRLSAQYNTQIGIWKFHSSWEDTIIGGKFTLAGRKELQFTKSWSLTGGNFLGSSSSISNSNKKKSDSGAQPSGGATETSSTTSQSTTTNNVMDDMVTRLRLRAAVDLQTWKAYVRVGFRTEQQSSPMMINVMEGFSIIKHIPLDGVNGQVKLEVKANFALPEPEIEYSTETHRSLVGMGDIEVGIEELNLLLDY